MRPVPDFAKRTRPRAGNGFEADESWADIPACRPASLHRFRVGPSVARWPTACERTLDVRAALVPLVLTALVALVARARVGVANMIAEKTPRQSRKSGSWHSRLTPRSHRHAGSDAP